MKLRQRLNAIEATPKPRKHKLTREMTAEEKQDLFTCFQGLCGTDDATTQKHLDDYEKEYESL